MHTETTHGHGCATPATVQCHTHAPIRHPRAFNCVARPDLRVNSYIVHDDTLVIALFILRAGDRPGAVLIVGVSNVVHDLGSVGDDVLLTKV